MLGLVVSWDPVQMVEVKYMELSSQNLLVRAHPGDVEEKVGLVYVHCQRPGRVGCGQQSKAPGSHLFMGLGDEKDKAEGGWVKEEKR